MKIILFILTLVFSSASVYSSPIHEETKFKTSDSIELFAKFTSKDKSSRYPAVLILEGSGKSSKTSESELNAFRQLAELLAENGISSLRFNKRGTGYNSQNGDYRKTTLEDNYTDAKNALKYLLENPRVIKDQVFVLGQSMGGTRATRLAVEYPKLKGLVLISSPSRPFKEFNNEQLKNLLLFKKVPKSKINKELSENTKWIDSLADSSFSCKKSTRCTQYQNVYLVDGQPIQYWVQLSKLKQTNQLSRVKMPTLIIQGTSDWVISVEDAKLAAKTLKKSGNKEYQLSIIEGFDHFFANNPTKEESIRYMINLKNKKLKPQLIHSEFRKLLVSWINTNRQSM